MLIAYKECGHLARAMDEKPGRFHRNKSFGVKKLPKQSQKLTS